MKTIDLSSSNDDEEPVPSGFTTTTTTTKCTSGILFSRPIRPTFCQFFLAPLGSDKQVMESWSPVVIRLQFWEQLSELRSFCRRNYQLGDWIELLPHDDEPSSWRLVPAVRRTIDRTSEISTQTKSWHPQSRWVLDVSSVQALQRYVRVERSQFWSMPQCQQWQNRFLNIGKAGKSSKSKRPKTSKAEQDFYQHNEQSSLSSKFTTTAVTTVTKPSPHGGALKKRLQGEHVAKFLISMIAQQKLTSDSNFSTMAKDDDFIAILKKDPSHWSTWDTFSMSQSPMYQQVVESLNRGNGVLDVAGGSGHVSMNLGLLGIASTVVDARQNVGQLPRKDRKFWNRALKQSHLDDKKYQCHPVVPFQTFRGWFGIMPVGVDGTFRHSDQESLLVCQDDSNLLQKASAIVALHPDEATGEIVRLAVQRRIPLVVVPCCVFARHFPDRQVTVTATAGNTGKRVSTYEDLLQFLKRQDVSIQQTQLPFEGKNIVLWTTFD